jgi:colicin import membrane protein
MTLPSQVGHNKKLMVFQSSVLNHEGYSSRAWIGMIALSVFCHMLFFSGAILLPGLRFTRSQIPIAVEVDLVSLPPAQFQAKPSSVEPVPSKTEEPVKSAAQPKTAEPEEKQREGLVPAPKEAVSSAPTRPLQVKRSEKQKTYDVSKAIDKAIARIEKEASEARPRPVLEAIDALRKKNQTTTDSMGTRGAVAGIGGGTKKALELLDIYHAEIWDLMRRNWAYSAELDPGRSDLEAVIIVKIMRDGEIRDMWFEERSGSSYFDDSCLRAVKKSNPLPPLPDGFLKPFHEVGFRFNPSELQGRP